MLRIRQAASVQDLQNILELQGENMKMQLSPQEIDAEGFITVRHSLEQLKIMQNLVPQVIATDEEQLAGYALVMGRELKNSIPVLIPMFDLLDALAYHGRPVRSLNYYVMGQICVRKSYRGKGSFVNSTTPTANCYQKTMTVALLKSLHQIFGRCAPILPWVFKCCTPLLTT